MALTAGKHFRETSEHMQIAWIAKMMPDATPNLESRLLLAEQCLVSKGTTRSGRPVPDTELCWNTRVISFCFFYSVYRHFEIEQINIAVTPDNRVVPKQKCKSRVRCKQYKTKRKEKKRKTKTGQTLQTKEENPRQRLRPRNSLTTKSCEKIKINEQHKKY